MTIAKPDSPLLPVYRRCDTVMVRGEGAYLYDDAGTQYLDFASGIATNALGHNHPALTKALHEQGDQLWHCSNLFHNQPLDAFATALTDACFAEKVFFCSSGTEAVESAIKTIRRFHHVHNTGKRNIIVVDGAFHGRSTGALAACTNEKSKEGFEPLMGGFVKAPFNDIEGLKEIINDQSAAIMLETIQGEGGVRMHDTAYLQEVRALCDAHGMLLFLDEIQCGYGRTGELFAYESANITPDIITCAKGIGGGFPLAAMLCTNHAASGMSQGTHGSTYGSNPLACAIGLAVLNVLQSDGFLQHVQEMGDLLQQRLQQCATNFPAIFTDVRGRGLMLGLGLHEDIDKYALSNALREKGLLVAPAVTHVLRILPPLIIEPAHIEQAITALEQTCYHYSKESA